MKWTRVHCRSNKHVYNINHHPIPRVLIFPFSPLLDPRDWKKLIHLADPLSLTVKEMWEADLLNVGSGWGTKGCLWVWWRTYLSCIETSTLAQAWRPSHQHVLEPTLHQEHSTKPLAKAWNLSPIWPHSPWTQHGGNNWGRGSLSYSTGPLLPISHPAMWELQSHWICLRPQTQTMATR